MINHPTPDGLPAWRGSGCDGWGREEAEFIEQMAADADNTWKTCAWLGFGIIGVLGGIGIFILFMLAAVVEWALPFLTSSWGLGIGAASVLSLIVATFMLERQARAR